MPLRLRNRSVDSLPNADIAYETLEKANDVELAVIDIMLATEDKGVSKFSRTETEDFLKTGLLLIDYLANARPDVFPRRFVVLTAASDRKLLKAIRDRCGPRKIEILRKMDYSSPVSLADKIESLLP
ncbi:hypothetical protein [Sulfitobacter geojensis]|uniref:hypothetical protein n=1 Tax=Sulfitobacter geojensis TaxID=1342299 RepID=UPI0012DDCE37|nr:hypothetical protein [Sulfitobacter geojensis]NYI28218.1 hypothetical protein [Sulfitobacter geojensis]